MKPNPNLTQDFYQTMPTHNMKRKDRIVMTRLKTGHCKLTHEYLKKQNPQCVSNATEFYQPIIFCLNVSSTTLKGKSIK